jgi:F-type H+-transporting ATPase subunit b
MPQITQLPLIFWSQLFWVALIFGFIFFVIGRGMLPKIQGTVDLRDQKIADDLERAQAARAEADETEAAWRSRMDAARSEAGRLAQDAKQKSAQETEKKVKAAADKLNLKIEASESKIRESLAAARAEIESVAAEATREMVQRLAGIAVDSKDAAAAVKAEMNG